MKIPSVARLAFCAVIATFGAVSASYADSGQVNLTVYKAGFFIGGNGGSGTLDFRGRQYSLSVAGIDYGLVFGGSKTTLRGRVSKINRASDVEGVYAAAGVGLAIGKGNRALVLTNEKGAVLELSGREQGLLANADLSGLAITVK